MEIIDLGLSDLEPVSMNFNESKPSVNFGSGIELLMNDKKRSSNSLNIDLGELDTLESELNEISGLGSSNNGGGGSGGDTKTLSGFSTNFLD